MIHVTVRVYNSGDRTLNGVRPEDLDNHIRHNTTNRWGCALFVDGKCVHHGYLSEERVRGIEAELAATPPRIGPSPYPYL